MPVKNYDPLFGGKGGAGKALSAMKKEYGDKKGTSVFYATINKRKKGKKTGLKDHIKTMRQKGHFKS
jgi:hypothetical protein